MEEDEDEVAVVVIETLKVPDGAGRRATSARVPSKVERSSWAY